MAALCNRADHYILILWFLISSSYYFFFPRLILAVRFSGQFSFGDTKARRLSCVGYSGSADIGHVEHAKFSKYKTENGHRGYVLFRRFVVS